MTRLHEAGKSHTGIKVLTGLFLLLNSSIAVAHQGPHESLMQVETQLQQEPENSELRFKKASLEYEMGHADDALKLLNTLIQEDSSSARYHYQRSLIYCSQKKYAEALSDLSIAIDQGQSPSSGYRDRAKVYRALCDHEQALGDYRTAASHKQDEDFIIDYASYLEQRELHDQSNSAYEAGVQNYPNSIHIKLEWMQYLMRQGKYGQALTLLEQYSAGAAFKTEFLLLQAECYPRGEQDDSAAKALNQALEECNAFLGKKDRLIHRYYRARVYYQQGRLDEAIADLNRVVDKTPRFKDCVELRNRILMERNSKNKKRMNKSNTAGS
jgi:tetratricopeptide (TPR) repeat protein